MIVFTNPISTDSTVAVTITGSVAPVGNGITIETLEEPWRILILCAPSEDGVIVLTFGEDPDDCAEAYMILDIVAYPPHVPEHVITIVQTTIPGYVYPNGFLILLHVIEASTDLLKLLASPLTRGIKMLWAIMMAAIVTPMRRRDA